MFKNELNNNYIVQLFYFFEVLMISNILIFSKRFVFIWWARVFWYSIKVMWNWKVPRKCIRTVLASDMISISKIFLLRFYKITPSQKLSWPPHHWLKTGVTHPLLRLETYWPTPLFPSGPNPPPPPPTSTFWPAPKQHATGTKLTVFKFWWSALMNNYIYYMYMAKSAQRSVKLLAWTSCGKASW